MTGSEGVPWPFCGRRDEVGQVERLVGDGAVAGVLLVGDAGSGKSGLAAEVTRRLEAAGRQVVRIMATPSGRDIPFGAVAHLLPRDLATLGGTEGLDRLAVLRAAQAAFEELPAPRPLVVLDDLDQLDGLSAVLVRQLVERNTVGVLATMRSGAVLADDLDRLRTSGAFTEIEVGPLDRPAVEEVLAAVLGGPVEPATVGAFASTSRGNPLVLRELIAGACERDELVRDGPDAPWRTTVALRGTRRVRDLIEARLVGLDASARHGLEVLSLAGELPLSLLEQVVGVAAVDELDRAGLLAVRAEGRRAHVGAGHPLHAEILRDQLSLLSARRIFGELVDALEARGARRREDPVRMGLWRLRSGAGASPDLLTRAAQVSVAFLDTDRAIDLATAAVEAGAGASATLLLSEAHSIKGNYGEVEALLATIDGASLDDEERVRLVIRRSSNLLHGLGDVDRALALYEEARPAVRDPVNRTRLDAKRAMLVATAGDIREAAAACAPHLEVDDLEARVQARYAAALVAMHDARFDDAATEAGRAYEDHNALEGVPGLGHPLAQLPTALESLALLGRVDEAEGYAHQIRVAVEPRGEPSGLALAYQLLGEVDLFRGRVGGARGWFDRALHASGPMTGSFRHADLLCLRGLVAAWGGDLDRASADLDEVDAMPVGVRAIILDRERLRGWVEVGRGRRTEARAVFVEGAGRAAELGDRYRQAMLLHDAVSVDERSPEVIGALEAIAKSTDAVVVAAWGAGAGAVARQDPDALTQAVDDLEQAGALLDAAFAAQLAADLHRATGDQRGARELDRRQAALVAATGAALPGLVVVDVVEPLTPREREIAALAADRLTNKEIAERLVVSVRTVENHLARVYDKLGVRRRQELGAALARDAP